ncbi:acyl-CoA thioester hydrolase/BAAT C-terminal domain-containing protein [Oceanicaulis alexandrii]|uniref:acyl-CoA thioester hydrolase/BAAT C-terminal domain-containing protein n=1 Tax=Oceanicaulis alexandrii TaxID=153233 RepID=UPI0035D09614
MRVRALCFASLLMMGLAGLVPPLRAQEMHAEYRDVDQIAEEFARIPHFDGRSSYTVNIRGFIDDIAVMDLEVNEVGDLPPLIVMVGGSEGGWWGRSTGFSPAGYLGQVLVDMGFSIRNLNHFGTDELADSWGEDLRPERLYERDLEPFARVLADARQTLGARNRCVGFIGISKGGELALLLAAYEAELNASETPLFDGVVASVPSHVVWQSPHRTMRVQSSWALGGEALDFVSYPWLSFHTPSVLLRRSSLAAFSEQALQNDAAVQNALIPVERIETPTLLQGALEDHLWPSAAMAEAAWNRAEALNPDHAVELRQYSTGHNVYSTPEAIADAALFMDEALRLAHSEGRCEASF